MKQSNRKGFTLLEKISCFNRRALFSKCSHGLNPSLGSLAKKRNPLTGFTLIEVLFAVTILVSCLVGLLATYLNMYILSDAMRDMTLVNSAVQAQMEEIKRSDFAAIDVLNNTVFDITGLNSANAKGRIEVASVTGYTDLKRVRIIACFRSRLRTIGNDINNCTTSPIELVTLISR